MRPRSHPVNRGLFMQAKIAGIESDAFVMLFIAVLATVAPLLADLHRVIFGYIGVFVAFAGYASLRYLYRQVDPRFFKKIRNYYRWNYTFRARPALIVDYYPYLNVFQKIRARFEKKPS